eukprot:TRINITY_DN10987_c0_g1_i1.p1 TRINITY_DN10987_c0_g1~~TRINITY_DN10987_c0_g1_i1.p1  ORF type:complete len:1018 (+),score=242.21 TRINITY_DN10987_c0_g1_i1:75-3128(+)
MAEVNIYFGSQSGTAECFSEELKEEAAQEGINAQVLDLQRFTPEDFAACRIAVMVVSTYGDGEPTDNAVAFHRWASDPRHDGALKGQRFTVMGLGDMNYSKFNNMGMMTDLNLERLGASRIYQRGIGDDCQDIAEDFAKWKSSGLWAALKKAIGEVQQEGPKAGAAVTAAATPVAVAPRVVKPDLYVFFGHDEEADGAAKDVCDAFTESCKAAGMQVSLVQSLKDRKAIEAVKKLPKKALAVIIADVSPDGMCSAARKLIRNMSLELDSGALSDKNLRFAMLTVASSKCNNSAASLKSSLEQHGQAIPKAFERAGVQPVAECECSYVDAGVEDIKPIVGKVCSAVAKELEKGATTIGGSSPAAPKEQAPATQHKVRIFTAGEEAKEAAEAVAAVWPVDSVTVEEASLSALASAAQQKVQAVVAVECSADGSLCDAARGLAAQLGATPMALKAQFRQLRFALVAVAATDYGNAGERASASAALSELTQAATPVKQALSSTGAGCVTSCCLDLQDANESKLAELATTLQKSFAAGLAPPAATPASYPNGTPNGTTNGTQPAAYGTPTLKFAAPGAVLPAETDSEATDVVARFYFDAVQAKILKVRELRQKPNKEEGVSTVEVELEAAGALKGYSAGGTLSLAPRNHPDQVSAALKLMGLSEADLNRQITFAAAEGGSFRVKKPFPTPCTLGDALACYCDLGRAPSKKMLAALQSKIATPEARECVAKLLADSESLKLLQSSPCCCSMSEFWTLLGVTGGLDPCDFLLHCPRQKAREFTIASSPKATPDRITLCVSLTSQESELSPLAEKLIQAGCLPASAAAAAQKRRFFGLCSQWLSCRLKAGDMVLAKQRTSPLQLPSKDVPVVMVGSGAGVAPFRGFWEELRRGAQTAPAALFFGCRHPDQDWLFKEEMNGAVKLGAGCGALARMQVGPKRPLTCLFPAFSRPGEGKEKCYVQDAIRAQSASVKAWVEKMAGCVFICGSSAMGQGVLDALAEVLEGGTETVEALRRDGRIVAEMWG